MPDKKKINAALERFTIKHQIYDKGSLSVVLTLTHRWRDKGFPITDTEIETPRGGQVKGLGGPVVKKILSNYGITRTLASEGGRTSRGSIDLARHYAKVLNEYFLSSKTHPEKELPLFEKWWIERIRDYFNRQGFQIQVDTSLSISAIINVILSKAIERQREMRGHTIVGTVLEHLIGAKLELEVGSDKITHKKVSTADSSSGAMGDFELADTVIHVTTSPSELLIAKCDENIRHGLRPVIICLTGLRSAAVSLASSIGIDNRIEVYEAQEFISMNINEWSCFSRPKLHENISKLIEKYNEIIDMVEPDKSLKIEKKK